MHCEFVITTCQCFRERGASIEMYERNVYLFKFISKKYCQYARNLPTVELLPVGRHAEGVVFAIYIWLQSMTKNDPPILSHSH
jgi:hypothetical protein